MKKQVFCLFVLLLALLTACNAPAAAPEAPALPEPPAQTTPPAAEKPAAQGMLASFTATDLDGNEIDQSIFSDYDITAVNIWATFCGPCKDDLPELAALQTEYADQSLQIIGIVTDAVTYQGEPDDAQIDVAKQLLEANGVTYLNLLPSENLMTAITDSIPVAGTPTTFFVDSEGSRIGKVYSGKQSKAGWTEIFDGLLADLREEPS